MDLHIEPGSIVCGVDGSYDGARALLWAAEQASLERRPLAVVTATDRDQAGALTWAAGAGTLDLPTDQLLDAASAVAESAAVVIRDKHPALDVLAQGALGDPREVLAKVTERAHLLVLGSRGRGTVRSKLLGSVSAAVSRHAHCPVVVCRPDSPGKVRKGVLVGADGTPESIPVLEFAFRAASARELPLTIRHSFPDVLAEMNGPRLVTSADADLDARRLMLAESLAGFAEKYPDVRVDRQLTGGHPDECLSIDSERWHLIVVGRHPTDSLSRMLSPTVATAVVERAHTTVAVVPVPAPVV